MRLTEFSVQNFKAIRGSVRLAPIETGSALIGPNNEGKTSLLEALHLARHLRRAIKASDSEAITWMTEHLPDKSLANEFALDICLVIEPEDVPPNNTGTW